MSQRATVLCLRPEFEYMSLGENHVIQKTGGSTTVCLCSIHKCQSVDVAANGVCMNSLVLVLCSPLKLSRSLLLSDEGVELCVRHLLLLLGRLVRLAVLLGLAGRLELLLGDGGNGESASERLDLGGGVVEAAHREWDGHAVLVIGTVLCVQVGTAGSHGAEAALVEHVLDARH